MPGAGGMLLITRSSNDRLDARFVCPAMFIPCIGARDEETAAAALESIRAWRLEKRALFAAEHNAR
jgi:protein-L-isoaspartate(D-aspartate) O-methyltransferase